MFSVSTLIFVLSVQSNVTCDLRGTTNVRHENCAFYRVRSTRWLACFFFVNAVAGLIEQRNHTCSLLES